MQNQLNLGNSNAFYKNERFLNLLFILFVFSVVLIRVTIFFDFSITIVDTDQMSMWVAAKDYSKGLFYEPRYYGQDYNTHMESLFALPLLWLSVPVYFAVPIATHFIFLFPYMFTASYLFFKQRKIHALLMLSIMLCLPASYDLLNSLPRGFVTGVFFTSFFIINVIDPYKLKYVLLNSIMALIGFFVNPNSFIASLPFLFYVFLYNYKNPKYYKVSLPCLLLLLPLHLLFNKFYFDHPDYLVLDLDYSFSADNFWKNITHLDNTFVQLSFFVEGNCLLLVAVFFVFLVCLNRQNTKAFFAFLLFMGLILVSFFMGKTREGSTWLFGSYSRLYLAIPFMLGLFATQIQITKRSLFIMLFFIPPLFSAYKIFNYQKLLAWHFEDKNWSGISLIPLKYAREAIDFYKRRCEENQVKNLIISRMFWLCPEVNYGGPAIHNNYPETEMTIFERRYYVRERNKNKIIKKFIFISMSNEFDVGIENNNCFKIKKLDNYGMYLITENKLKTREFIYMADAVEMRHQ